MPTFRRSLEAALAALLIVLPAAAGAQDGDGAALPRLGLMGTIPIYWGEADGLSGHLSDEQSVHWARAQLERRFSLQPLDTLGEVQLAGLSFLLLAQPRALTPQENVALDAWVRAGGRLLLFADPMLTGHSRFALGDRRRPQDVALLSPILAHWGLRLEFVEDQPEAARSVAGQQGSLPIRLAGRFVRTGGGDCVPEAEGLLAPCRLGEGAALLVADAAMLDLHDPAPEAPTALASLLSRIFPQDGDDAGKAAPRADIEENQYFAGEMVAAKPPD